ncbi:hypothetical protein CEXT_411471 [Caerostris extrusa]|uniref:Uncharacterized protein n=1 Tax=Caerostris extrusa TaxID=172846 RepID=A0AAV4YF22_CAEEX|nr:hypothetical protein CEXT_411471 [Caerostris extrusa]
MTERIRRGFDGVGKMEINPWCENVKDYPLGFWDGQSIPPRRRRHCLNGSFTRILCLGMGSIHFLDL